MPPRYPQQKLPASLCLASVLLFGLQITATSEPALSGHFGSTAPTYFPGQSLGKYEGDTLVKLSGAAVGRVNPDVLWVHNDGPAKEIFVIQKDGTHTATFSLSAETQDVEDLAIGPGPEAGTHYLYLGDIGSANGSRTNISVFRMPEPSLAVSATLEQHTDISLTYPDGGHAAKTLMLDPLSGDLLVATFEANRTRIYRASTEQHKEGPASELEFVGEVEFSLATGGDISSDGTLIALRAEDEARIWDRKINESIGEALSRPGARAPVVAHPKETNGEALAFEPNSPEYLTVSEGKKEHVFHFRPNPSGFDAGSRHGFLEDPDLKEISGCAVSRQSSNVLWIHNDGPIDRIHAIDVHGRVLASVELGRTLTDAEDMTIARIVDPEQERPYLFIGDIGDNDSDRNSIGVLRFPEPPIDPNHQGPPLVLTATGAEWLGLRYPNGASDAETIMFDPTTNDLLIATKNEFRSEIFRFPAMSDSAQTQTLEFVTQIPFPLVSAGDISANGSEIIFRREEFASLWKRESGATLAQALSAPSREIPVMTPPKESNGESIAFNHDASSYFTIGEKKNAPVFSFSRRNISDLVRLVGSPKLVQGEVTLNLEGFPGLTASLEYSTDLSLWRPARAITLNDLGNSIITLGPAQAREYYRVRR